AASAPRPEWLINVTNDGWYGDSPGPYQHLASAQFRAVEEGLPLVRSANTGISAVVDAYGRTLIKFAYGTENAADVLLPAAAPLPLYARFGDYPLLILVVLFSLGCIRLRKF